MLTNQKKGKNKMITQAEYEKKMASYRFDVRGTGGNCTAFYRQIKLGDKDFEILIANELETPRVGEWAIAQYSDEDGNHFGFALKDHDAVLLLAKTLETN